MQAVEAKECGPAVGRHVLPAPEGLGRAINLYNHGANPSEFYEFCSRALPIAIRLDASNNPIEFAERGLEVEPSDPNAFLSAPRGGAQRRSSESKPPGQRSWARFGETHRFPAWAVRLTDVVPSALAAV